MRFWYTFHVREWFLAPRDWDQVYEAGDSRECWTSFLFEDNDEEARKHLIETAKEDDIELEIFDMGKSEEKCH